MLKYLIIYNGYLQMSLSSKFYAIYCVKIPH